MAVGLSDGPSYPEHSTSNIFFAVLLSEQPHKRSAQSPYNWSPFSSPTTFFPVFLFFLHLLMSCNVHPNSGPVFPCSVCAGNVIWWNRSVQQCPCSKSVYLSCSILSCSKFNAPGINHSRSCTPCCVFASPGGTQTFNTKNSYSSGTPSTYTFTVQSVPTMDFFKAFDFILHLALFHKPISAGLSPCFAC